MGLAKNAATPDGPCSCAGFEGAATVEVVAAGAPGAGVPAAAAGAGTGGATGPTGAGTGAAVGAAAPPGGEAGAPGGGEVGGLAGWGVACTESCAQ
jgi:hypothetical protein